MVLLSYIKNVRIRCTTCTTEFSFNAIEALRVDVLHHILQNPGHGVMADIHDIVGDDRQKGIQFWYNFFKNIYGRPDN